MIPILMYHQIGEPAPKGAPYRSLSVHPADFKRQMTWLQRFGYRGLSMHDLMPYIKGERQGRVVGITFDDGYRNVYNNALPVLRKLDFTATNYIVSNQIDGGNVWDYPKGIAHSDLMSADELRGWILAGCEVGSHTLSHPNLPKISTEQADIEIRASKAELEQALDIEVSAFCYPYGAESLELRDRVKQAGYNNATTTARGLVQASDDFFGLPRVTVARSTNIFRFLQKCLTRLEARKSRG